MKAKIRGHNLPTQRQSDLEKAARQFIDDYIDDYIKKLQYRKEKARNRGGGYEPREMKSNNSITNNE